MRVLILLVIVLLTPTVCNSGWFGKTETYEDCILKNMKGVTSDVAARSIRSACYEKDSERKKAILKDKMTRLKAWPIVNYLNIKGGAQIKETYDYRKGILIEVRSEDKEWELLRITVSVLDKQRGTVTKTTVDAEHDKVESTFYAWVFPESIPEDWSWSIESAEGVPL